MPSKHTNVTVMIEGALCIALSVVLSKFSLFVMPQGGSADFGLMPLMIFAYRRGLKMGILVGALTGLMGILLDSYVYSPIQAILDYPLAFAFVGLSAIQPKILGMILAALGKIASHVISGAIFFAEYAPEGQNVWVYSLVYNVPVQCVKFLISGIAAIIIWKALERALPVSESK